MERSKPAHSCHLNLVGDVGGEYFGVSASVANLIGDFLQLGAVPRYESDTRPGVRECDGNRFAEPLARAGDERGLAFEGSSHAGRLGNHGGRNNACLSSEIDPPPRVARARGLAFPYWLAK